MRDELPLAPSSPTGVVPVSLRLSDVLLEPPSRLPESRSLGPAKDSDGIFRRDSKGGMLPNAGHPSVF